MKMYHLNPNDYGQSYFVLANSKEEALEYIISSKEYECEQFRGETINSLPHKYTMDELDLGDVVSREIC